MNATNQIATSLVLHNPDGPSVRDIVQVAGAFYAYIDGEHVALGAGSTVLHVCRLKDLKPARPIVKLPKLADDTDDESDAGDGTAPPAWMAYRVDDPRVGDKLTPREVEILWLIADGLSNPAISIEIGISEHTVKFHLMNALAKLGTSSRTAGAVALVLSMPAEAAERGLPRSVARVSA